MAAPYVINITNGTGTKAMVNGSYDTTASVNGYNNLSVLPINPTITEGVNTYDFTIAATGTLTMHVTEDGTSEGTAVVGAKFARCDSAGTTYGDEITTDENGDADFGYVPYADTDAPLVYYKQTQSDGDHEFVSTLTSTSLTTSTKTVEVENTPAANRTVNLTDVNYDGLPIGTGEITLT